jgi:hypothetical protein
MDAVHLIVILHLTSNRFCSRQPSAALRAMVVAVARSTL